MTITVIVDDNDPAIVYGGAWTAMHPSALGIKGINQTVGNTLHNTSIGDTSQESFFSFNFSGTTVSVFAMVMSSNKMQLFGAPYPWKCIIDQQPTAPLLITGVDIPTTILLCQAAGLPDGPHLLNFMFNIPTGSGNISSVFLDYIEYLPSASATSRAFEFTAVSFDDPSVGFDKPIGGFVSQGWTTIPGLNDGTTGLSIPALEPALEPNTSAGIDIQFTGTSLTWIGFTDPGFSVSGIYSIDFQSFIQIEIPLANNTFLQPGRVFFQTPLLDKGQHGVVAEYASSNVSHQLSIQKFIIGNGTVPAGSNVAVKTTTPLIPPSGTSSVQTASSTRPALHRPVPIIVGIVTGVSIVTFIIVSAIIRKRHRQRRAQRPPPIVQPFSSQPTTIIARLLAYPSIATLDIKGRRRLLPPVEEPTHPGIIPPLKLATRRVSAAAADSPEPTPEPVPVADVDDEGSNIANPPVRLSRTRGIQEEDSGLRTVEQLGEYEESVIHVMPPAYTAD